MYDNHIRMLCAVIKTDVVLEDTDGLLTAYFDNTEDSPIMQNAQLRTRLKKGLAQHRSPFLAGEDMGTFYAALTSSQGTLFLGPMCTEKLNAIRRAKLLRSYGITVPQSRALPAFTPMEIRNIVLLTNSALQNTSLDNDEMLLLNRFISQNEQRMKEEQTDFVLKEEEQNDADASRHTYHEEELLMQAVREGNSEEAIRIAGNMDADSGRLSISETGHWRNLAIFGVALCARAAVSGGVSPESAYRISGYYIKKCDASMDAAHILHHRNRCIEELCARVRERNAAVNGSTHVGRAKDYIRKHYREKLYLKDIAENIGISPTYLSRRFKEETGVELQNYIVDRRVDRAAELLLYSDLELSDIAEYVNFPGQSYFGKVFKSRKGMSPNAYRIKYRIAEANDDHSNGS